jgi:hypothetical protein
MEQQEQKPSATCVDLTGQTPLIAPEIMRQVMEHSPAAWEKGAAAGTTRETRPGLRNKQYRAAFASDLPTETLTFSVQGREAWVKLRKMDSGSTEEFSTVGVGIVTDPLTGDLAVDPTQLNVRERHLFLVSHTLRGCSIPTQNAAGDWTTIVLPAEPAQVPEFVERHFRCDPDFWGDLVQDCYRTNGLAPEDEGNSPS